MVKSSQHPVQNAIRTAVSQRLGRIEALFPSDSERDAFCRATPKLIAGTATPIQAQEAQQALQFYRKVSQLSSLLEEVRELESWLSPPMSLQTRADSANRAADLLVAEGMSFGDVEDTIRPTRGNPRGAPAKRRIVAARALELKRLNRRLDWMRVTQECCNCGKEQHTHSCMQVVRQEVMALEKVLKKYGIHPFVKVLKKNPPFFTAKNPTQFYYIYPVRNPEHTVLFDSHGGGTHRGEQSTTDNR